MKYIKILFIAVTFFTIHSCKERITEPDISQLNYEIVFNSNRDGNFEIYVMNADGSNQTRLTNNNVKDWFPKWSPDGERIAYLSEVNGKNQLFVMNKDGSNQKQISFDLNIYNGYEWIEWSPDGAKILIQVFSEQNIRQIYIINADGSNQALLIEGNYPNWVEQNKIIFGGDGICSINSDGSNLIQITDGTIFDFCPVVSPHYDKIIFRSFRDNDSGKASLHIMNLDGSDIKELSKKDPIIKSSFSPINTDILFVAPETVLGFYDKIFRVNINTNNEELIIDLGSAQSTPVYSSDGNKIVFSTFTNDGRADIYIKNLSNGSITKLTNYQGVFPINDYPDWNPKK
ncbi:MAG: DUF5050 domain-containing protein [Ignavibacteriota bacterium]|jgi:Tol biopolymer transport system component|nr:PD40 domain-containing protein [Ignavibacteriales bacterium]MBL1121591.1 DUF5050 domain-containing protein [Ignavibacteriota bacterium]MBV6419356.1 Protein TolB [Ignavibacteriaceae bacterium]MCE7855263.1 DUF5050 domain-containing protein [Ignavibacteria bacterium CHB3]MCC7093621.1 PD40 domain-containing protein [Ignavibacteriaceae bacterium]